VKSIHIGSALVALGLNLGFVSMARSQQQAPPLQLPYNADFSKVGELSRIQIPELGAYIGTVMRTRAYFEQRIATDNETIAAEEAAGGSTEPDLRYVRDIEFCRLAESAIEQADQVTDGFSLSKDFDKEFYVTKMTVDVTDLLDYALLGCRFNPIDKGFRSALWDDVAILGEPNRKNRKHKLFIECREDQQRHC
jgi:hypothetical protein